MHSSRFVAASLTLSLLVSFTCTGCVNGPFGRLAGWNPYYKSQWDADEQKGPTFHRRMVEIRQLRSSTRRMNPQGQDQIARQMGELYRADKNPLIRAATIGVLGEIASPAAVPTLQAASGDEDSDVRIAACKAWGRRGGPEAIQALSNLVGSDSNVDVRIAATTELGKFSDATAIHALGVALDDRDPALQLQAVAALEQSTGQDMSGSISVARAYVRGETLPPAERRSIVSRVRELF